MKQLKFMIAVIALVLVILILAVILSEYKIENIRANLAQTIEAQETKYVELEATGTLHVKVYQITQKQAYEYWSMYATVVAKPTQTPWVITATPEPTFIPTATTNPAWISIWITQNTRAYEFSGRYNGNGDMILDITEIILLQGKELLVHKNRIQVDGMRVYQIIGPVAIGLYVPIDHTTK